MANILDKTELTTVDGNIKLYAVSADGTTDHFILLSTLLKGVNATTVSPSSGTITFDFLNLPEKTFKTTLSTENVTTLSVSKATNEVHFYWMLDVTGTCNITLRTGAELNEDNLPASVTYSSGTRVLTITAGTNDLFTISSIKDGSTIRYVVAQLNTPA